MNERMVERKWNHDANFALKFSKFCVWPLGLWPFDSDNGFAWFRLVFSFFSQLWMIGTQFVAIYLNCGNEEATVDYVMLTVCAFMALSKIVALRVNMEKIRVILISAQDDLLSIPDEDTRQIVRPFVKKSRKVFYIQIVSSYVSNVIIFIGSMPFLMPPVANETLWDNETLNVPMRQLPLQTGCIFAHFRDGLYALLYAFEGIQITCTLHGNVGSDVLIYTLAMYLCSQIELLKVELAEIGTDSEDSKSRSRIIKYVRRHTYLLELAQYLNESISGMLGIQLLLNAGMNLMLGLRIIMAIKSGMFVTAIRPILAFNVLMLQLYFLCYAGERLACQTESISDAIYDSNWYQLTAKLRKYVYFFSMRANKPVYLVAGKIYIMNLDNFKNVIKASFSYFSILQMMFEA